MGGLAINGDEYFTFGVFSIISSVMCLEAYVNEILIDIGGLHADLPAVSPGGILVEKKIQKIFQSSGILEPYSITEEAKNLVFLRNQYIH